MAVSRVKNLPSRPHACLMYPWKAALGMHSAQLMLRRLEKNVQSAQLQGMGLLHATP